jgi:hypothetical protein
LNSTIWVIEEIGDGVSQAFSADWIVLLLVAVILLVVVLTIVRVEFETAIAFTLLPFVLLSIYVGNMFGGWVLGFIAIMYAIIIGLSIWRLFQS